MSSTGFASNRRSLPRAGMKVAGTRDNRRKKRGERIAPLSPLHLNATSKNWPAHYDFFLAAVFFGALFTSGFLAAALAGAGFLVAMCGFPPF